MAVRWISPRRRESCRMERNDWGLVLPKIFPCIQLAWREQRDTPLRTILKFFVSPAKLWASFLPANDRRAILCPARWEFIRPPARRSRDSVGAAFLPRSRSLVLTLVFLTCYQFPYWMAAQSSCF